MLGESRERKNYNHQKPSRSPTNTDETESPSSKVDSLNTQGLQFQHSTSLRQLRGIGGLVILSFNLLNDLWSLSRSGVRMALEFLWYLMEVTVVQYYVPYLTGIQTYSEAAALRSDSHARLACEDSDGSIDYDLRKSFYFSREQWNHHHLACENMLKMRKRSLTDERKTVQEGILCDVGMQNILEVVCSFNFLSKIFFSTYTIG